MLLLAFTPSIDAAVNARVIAVAAALDALTIAGVRDIVPAYCSVAVHYDPLVTDVDALSSRMMDAAAAIGRAPIRRDRVIEVPVCYDEAFGADLEAISVFAALSRPEVVRRHAAPEYRVYMLGFLPGFAYMGTVDPSIAMPRQATPRTEVMGGAVGIAGAQTGIYTMASPGGWRIVGRTPLRPFDAARAEPFLFAAGDRVRFVAIDRAEFDRTSEWE